MMMDTAVYTGGTAFICPECSFNGKSLPELISHLNEAHGEENASKNEAPSKSVPPSAQPEKRSRRKPAFSHQIVAQAPRQPPPLYKQVPQSNAGSGRGFNELWDRIATEKNDGNDNRAIASSEDSSTSNGGDENNNSNGFDSSSSVHPPPPLATRTAVANKLQPNVLHSILSQQRPIAPKNGVSLTPNKISPASSSTKSPSLNVSLPLTSSSKFIPTDTLASSPMDSSSPSIGSMQHQHRKNFSCRMCQLTYKNFHDCTAHIRKKHEISHAQAGRYVEKLDTDAPLPPSASGQYKIRFKVKSLPLPTTKPVLSMATKKMPLNDPTYNMAKLFRCKYCSYSSNWSKDITRHQRRIHPNFPPHVIKTAFASQPPPRSSSQKQEVHAEEETEPEHDDEEVSALLIDEVRALGEEIDIIPENNAGEMDETESQDDEMLMIEEDEDDDDALWKYQQQVNDTSEQNATTATSISSHSHAKRFKKFRCPHCDHSAPTLTKLKLHVATHINIKPYMCSLCGWRANLRWYIQCHAKKRHPNKNFEVLQLSNEEAEQTINAYMKERGLETKLFGGNDSKRRFQCSLCQFRSNHPKFVEQHIASQHASKAYAKMIISKKQLSKEPTSNGPSMKLTTKTAITNGHTVEGMTDQMLSTFMIKPKQNERTTALFLNSNGDYLDEIRYDDHDEDEQKDPNAGSKTNYPTSSLYTRSSLLQSDGTIAVPDPNAVVYPNFSTHVNFNPNRLFYCALCYRGYRWRYDVKRHHKTMHETLEDEAEMGLSLSPKSIKRRNKEFNRTFRYFEYVPQLDGLIPATMSCSNNNATTSLKHGNGENGCDDDDEDEDDRIIGQTTDDDSQEDELKLSIGDARSVDITEDEAAALFMIEPQRSDNSTMLDNDHGDDSIIVFEDDRPPAATTTAPPPPPPPPPPTLSVKDKDKLSRSQSKSLVPTPVNINSSTIKPSSARAPSGFKPFRCPHCFYRTNWRTDSLRHIRARHKVEPSHDGYYEMSADEAERTYAEYERTFGFVVSKKVLGRFTDFRHIEWAELQKSIYEKIKDKSGYEQIILDRLRPEGYPESQETSKSIPTTTPTVVLAKVPAPVIPPAKPKRLFACIECGFRSSKMVELDKHVCARTQRSEKIRGKLSVSLFQCTKCQYRTVSQNRARQHIDLHRLNKIKKIDAYYCACCGYNNRRRRMVTLHIARNHPTRVSSTTIVPFRYAADADFSIRQATVRRSLIECQFKQQRRRRQFYCIDCPHVSISVLEHDHHRSCHQLNSQSLFKCDHCSFSSNSSLYTRQHMLLHSKAARHSDASHLKNIDVLTIFKETLAKHRRCYCPFCTTFSSNSSSAVLQHIKNTHAGNSNQLDDSLIIGSEMVKEILSLGETINDDTDDLRMDIS